MHVSRPAFADQLAAIGPPPYANMLDYPVAISSNPEWHDFEPGPDHSSRSSYPMNLFVPELTLTEQIRSASALVDTFAVRRIEALHRALCGCHIEIRDRYREYMGCG